MRDLEAMVWGVLMCVLVATSCVPEGTLLTPDGTGATGGIDGAGGTGATGGIDGAGGQGKCLWSFANSESNDQFFRGIAVDSQSNAIIVGGYFADSLSFPSKDDQACKLDSFDGTNDVFMAKFDSDGKCLWTKGFGGTGDDRLSAMSDGPDGSIFLVGRSRENLFGTCAGADTDTNSNNDMFLAKLDSQGACVWRKRFSAAKHDDEQTYELKIDVDGTNVVIMGDFVEDISLGGPTLSAVQKINVFVAKFALDGTYLSSKSFPDGDQQRTGGLALDAQGYSLVSGYFFGGIDFGPSNGNLPLTSSGHADIFVAKLDDAFNVVWSKRFGDAGVQYGGSVAVQGQRGILLTGSFREDNFNFGGWSLANQNVNTYDGYLVELDDDPNTGPTHEWTRTFGTETTPLGGVASDGTGAVTSDSDGNVIVTGTANGAINLGGEMLPAPPGGSLFVAKYSQGGSHIWSHVVAASNNSDFGVAVDDQGNVLVAGTTDYQMTDCAPGMAAGSNNVFVAKLRP